ncbi:MAG: PorT family protein [Treponema sp.]|nr:PorT family protein [Treponema sp.]MBR0032353.1 PorT family protein [Treponema sp.]
MKYIAILLLSVLVLSTGFAKEMSVELGFRGSFDLNLFDFTESDLNYSEASTGTGTGRDVKYENRKYVWYNYTYNYSESRSDEAKSKSSPGAGVDFFANIGLPFVKGLGVQPELGIHWHRVNFDFNIDGSYSYTYPNGEKENKSEAYNYSHEESFDYMTLDIPILVTYTILFGKKFFVRPEVGPKISLIMGNLFYGDYGDYDDYEVKSPFQFGIEAGACLGYAINDVISLLIDVRYNRNFTKLEVEYESGRYSSTTTLGSEQSVIFSVGLQINLAKAFTISTYTRPAM